MQWWLNITWIITVFVNLSGLIWFVLGSTASFQRDLDLISTVLLVYLGIPTIILGGLSFYLLYKKWSPTKWWEAIGVSLLMIAMLFMTPQFYKNVDTSGWLTDKVQTDSIQQTSDHRFEYCIELINLFQKNSTARLYLKNINTLEEVRIPLELPTKEVVGITWSSVNYFIKLEPTADSNIYLLTTTEGLPLATEKYEINVQEGTAVRIK
ncbi:hypothetical protein [Brevibacillus brevis]|uniref:hypothetical protein n=1 Tax=Brevibacillus brevis TaxID=1393 RepID=UPI000D0EF922|nr:hypothetical protein [Brevibacillus brevis]PSJ69261.1 hypothetical protein C7J99_11205 [Brevibacillus brevis]RED27445.1 hypothetical protein DES34_110137 [Brevibacillus brevis]GEC90796.1 hypothetical protein BBR01nite_31270 [Brevibacillus brevis]VEF91298.1 Uncharacterised protein [Brevibacillus brevis]